MFALPKIRLTLLAAVCVVAGATFGAAPVAHATTGPTQFLPASRYKLASAQMAQYKGQYVLKSVAPAAHLRGGAMGIEPNNRGFLAGVGQFYGYDAQGRQSTWTATLYNFHLTKAKVLLFDLLSPAGATVIGRFSGTRATSGDITGQIQLGTGRFAIQWHKISSR
ncbi:MAG: hypothetical protein JWO59_1445 [Chloroflexi bacterium]|nr:hypothetical protein [Chloroflexota bacterium]